LEILQKLVTTPRLSIEEVGIELKAITVSYKTVFEQLGITAPLTLEDASQEYVGSVVQESTLVFLLRDER